MTWPKPSPCWSKDRRWTPRLQTPRDASNRPSTKGLSRSSNACSNESWNSSGDSGKWPANAPPPRPRKQPSQALRKRPPANRNWTEADMASEAKTNAKDDDAPLIDLNDASIKKLITKAKRRGYITYDELNEAL